MAGKPRPLKALFVAGIAAALVQLPMAPSRAAFPGTNGRIVYDYQGDIWIVGSGEYPVNLTRTPGVTEAHPEFSDDARHIVYTATATGEDDWDLFEIHDDGRDRERLTDDSGYEDGASWAPDDHTIELYTTRSGSVYGLNINEDEVERITDTGDDLHPVSGPNGGRIAFERDFGDHVGLVIAQDTGSDAVEVTDDDEDSFNPDWSPTGRDLVFDRDGQIWTVSARGEERQLTDGSVRYANPVWSPDGYFIAAMSPAGIVLLDTNGSALMTVTAAGSSLDWEAIPVEEDEEEEPAPAPVATPTPRPDDSGSGDGDGDGCTVTGTSGDDKLYGTNERDIVCGKGGDDLLLGGGGHDLLMGGAGNDGIAGYDGRDVMKGGAGDDRMIGNGGRDKLYGGSGHDLLVGAEGKDECRRGKGKGKEYDCELPRRSPRLPEEYRDGDDD